MTPVGKMGIPEVRSRLITIANELNSGSLSRTDAAKQIYALIPHLKRNSYVRRAPTQSVDITPEIIQKIRDAVTFNPDRTIQSIAEEFGINAGRVSEILHGLRK